MRAGRLEIITFVAGASVMIVEIGGARLLAPYLGNTIFTWTSIISVVLASLATGYHIGGRIADRKPEIRLLAVFLLGAAIAIGLTPFVAASVLFFVSSAFGFEYGPLVASLALLAAPNVCLGIVAPYAVRLKAQSIASVGESAGNLYAISTAGSIAGALLTGYALIPYLGVRATFGLTAGALALVGAWTLGVRAWPAVATVALAIVLTPLGAENLYPGEIRYQTDTPYYHLQVLERRGELRLVTDLTLQTSLFRRSATGEAYYDYQRLLYASGAPLQRALFLGVGGGAMVADIYRNTAAQIDLVEIDPVVIGVAERYFGLETRSPRVKAYVQDARFFLDCSERRYDAIVLDAYGSALAVPYQLTTREAVGQIAAHLTGKGALFVNMISPYAGENSGAFRSFLKTLRTEFPTVYVFALAPDDPDILQNIVLVATKERARRTATQLSDAFGAFGRERVAALMRGYRPESIATADVPVLTDDKNPIDLYAARALAAAPAYQH
jgi:predicted membrane-bound spermidine synthase